MTKKQYRTWKREQTKKIRQAQEILMDLLDEARRVHKTVLFDEYTRAVEGTAHALRASRDSLKDRRRHVNVETVDPDRHDEVWSTIGSALKKTYNTKKLAQMRERRNA